MVAYPAQANNYVYFVNPVGIIEWSGPLQQRHWLELKTHHCFQNSRVHYNRSWPIEGSGKQILVQNCGRSVSNSDGHRLYVLALIYGRTINELLSLYGIP